MKNVFYWKNPNGHKPRSSKLINFISKQFTNICMYYIGLCVWVLDLLPYGFYGGVSCLMWNSPNISTLTSLFEKLFNLYSIETIRVQSTRACWGTVKRICWMSRFGEAFEWGGFCCTENFLRCWVGGDIYRMAILQKRAIYSFVDMGSCFQVNFQILVC